MLARTVDAGKRFFVKQTTESMFTGNPAHQRHQQHIMVNGQVAFLKNRGQFKLIGSHLVMARLTRDSQFQSLNLQVTHKGGYPFRYGTKIMVIHLLIFGRFVTHERAACHHKVGTYSKEVFINKKILLFPAQIGGHFLHFGIKEMADFSGSTVNGSQGFLQRCLVVESLTRI